MNLSMPAILICLATAHALSVRQAEGNGQRPVEPTRVSQKGDYKIERYELKVGDLLRLKERGVYKVTGIAAHILTLRPVPPMSPGIGPAEWKIAKGRGPIGNRNYLDVQALDATKNTATVLVEWKTRWRWWDGLAF